MLRKKEKKIKVIHVLSVSETLEEGREKGNSGCMLSPEQRVSSVVTLNSQKLTSWSQRNEACHGLGWAGGAC